MNILYSIFSLACAVVGSLLILRAYLWSLAITPRDPLARLAWKFTDWMVGPVSYAVKPRGCWDWPSILSALIVAVVEVLVMREVTGFPVTPLSFAVTPFALLLRWAVDLVIWGLIIYCVLSFVSQPYSPYMAILGTLLDPFLRPFRRLIPLIGRFDITPIILFLLLNLLLRFVMPASMGLLVL